MCPAIGVGGDVDTTAAMAGAISGARLGLAAPPTPFVKRLDDKGAWGYEERVALARESFAVKSGSGTSSP